MFVRCALPFADNPNADCNADQLLLAVFACAHTYEEGVEGQVSGEWATSYERWIAKVQKTRPDMKAALATFRAHLADGYRMAPVWRHISSQCITMSAPWEEILKCRLVRAGFSLSDVMNGYLPERWYDYFAVCEIDAFLACEDTSRWKPTFYTVEDALRDEESGGQPGKEAARIEQKPLKDGLLPTREGKDTPDCEKPLKTEKP